MNRLKIVDPEFLAVFLNKKIQGGWGRGIFILGVTKRWRSCSLPDLGRDNGMKNTVLWLPGQRHLKGLLGRGTAGNHRRQEGPLFFHIMTFKAFKYVPATHHGTNPGRGGGSAPAPLTRATSHLCSTKMCTRRYTLPGWFASQCMPDQCNGIPGDEFLFEGVAKGNCQEKGNFFDKKQINTKLSGETAAFILAGALPLRQNP